MTERNGGRADGDSGDWLDERLAAAFQARAAGRSTPADLSMAAVERLQRTAPDRSARLSRRGIGFALTSVAVVVVLVGVVAVVPRNSSPAATPITALGLPIVSVAEAIAVHDGDAGDREIAVRGWFSSALPLPCPAPPGSVNPVRLQCPFGSQWLLDTPEPLAAGQSTPRSGRAGFQPLLSFLDLTALTAAAQPSTTAARLPEVILIGHFHDRRGVPTLCDAFDSSSCAGFVADGIFSIDGVRAASSTVIDMEPWEPELRREPTWTPANVDSLFRAALPSLEILSRVALPGHRVSQLEPALGTGILGIINRDVVWSVTGLDADIDGRPVRRTFLVVDGTAEAYESAPWEVSNIGFVPFALVPLQTAPSPVVASLESDADTLRSPAARQPQPS